MNTVMQKVFKNSYLLTVVLFFFAASCGDPLQEAIDEINETVAIAKIFEYTLTDDDYDIADDACSCAGFGNFSSDDDVRTNIPIILDAVFPALGKGSAATVTYDFFNGSSPDIRGTQQTFTVSAQEYDDLGFGFGNFSDLAEDLPLYADYKVGDASDGDYLDVTHDYWNGSFVETLTTRVVWTVAYGWMWAEPLPDDSYADFFGESPPDFSFEDEGEDMIPFWLKATKIFAEEGDRALIQWNWDNGPGTSQSVALWFFVDGEWLEYGDYAQTTQESLNFGHNGDGWEPDNTIRYTLGADDYSAIAAAYQGINDPGSDSMNTFGNYDLTLWSSQEIFDSITARLLELFPSQEVGQKWLIEYRVWRPGSGTDTLNIIYDGSGFSIIE